MKLDFPNLPISGIEKLREMVAENPECEAADMLAAMKQAIAEFDDVLRMRDEAINLAEKAISMLRSI